MWEMTSCFLLENKHDLLLLAFPAEEFSWAFIYEKHKLQISLDSSTCVRERPEERNHSLVNPTFLRCHINSRIKQGLPVALHTKKKNKT